VLVIVGDKLLASDRVHIQAPDLYLRTALAPRVTLFVLEFFNGFLLFDTGITFLATVSPSFEVAGLIERFIVFNLFLLVLHAPDRL